MPASFRIKGVFRLSSKVPLDRAVSQALCCAASLKTGVEMGPS